MVTRTVILVAASEAAAFAATSTLSSSTAAAAAESVMSNAPPAEQNSTEELQTNNLCNYPSYSKPAQHPAPVGLVQLCRHKGCFHAVDFERRNGGLCCIHQKEPMDGEQSDSEDSEDDRKICGGTVDEELCDRHSTHDNNYGLDDEIGKKRDLPSAGSIGGNKTKKCKKVNAFAFDLTDVSPQSPIPKSAGYIKEGASKYAGVTFNKQTNKWHAQIMIDGKQRFIGSYENEEEAAVDYARAVFKYKGQGALGKAREQDSFTIDLSDVPPQPPIPRSAGRIKEGISKYTGVHFNKRANKWKAQIMIDGKYRHIGTYENEEAAAVDYARAVFKYEGRGEPDNAREQDSFIIDLSDVPPQPPIPKSSGSIKEGASKYTGVSFDKRMNKWQAKIYIDGKLQFIGYYENEEEAAVDYARAVFKYKNQAALGKAREQDSFIIDLSDVPPQPPIPKSSGKIKEGASKYTGVYFNKQTNKWRVQIDIKGKNRTIGYYENEEEAAADYARAVFKYKGQGALDKARERRALDNAREQDSIIIDLSGVPPQPPISNSAGLIKEGASKYTGVYFNKKANKWLANIRMEGKQRLIGSYENEEEAAVDYARAVFNYKGQGALDKAREQDSFIIDLSDVPPQSPIPNSEVQIKEGSSKYIGVTFNKQTNTWYARIMIEGKNRHIGCYESEEEAAVDYARAVFKYKGQGALDKARERRARDKSRERNSFIIDLSDVSSQPPTPKSGGRIKEGTSKYTGVSFNKRTNKWKAQISIDGKHLHIGYYDNEEAAAVDYARAVFKYKNQAALGKARERRALKKAREKESIIDLTGIPPQSPIPKSKGRIKEGASKYTGVHFNKQTNKWHAQIYIDGKIRLIGYYDNEEEAAVDFARAVFKYKGQCALDKAREQNSFIIDLTDVPRQPPIPKSAGHIKEGASKYTGVYFHKPIKKWLAKIYIDGKERSIGYYENEEAAAVDYARAVFKYKGEGALDKAREQDSIIIDLSNVPPQPPIPKIVGRIREGASKYTGVSFNKSKNKWTAQIKIAGMSRFIGSYENEEKAAVDYARAVFKYKVQGALDKARERRARDLQE